MIISDDDSTMRAFIRHKSNLSRKGRLPEEIPEPSRLTDPSHRTKVVAGKVYALANPAEKPINLL